MIRFGRAIGMLILAGASLFAQEHAIVPIWPDGAPGAKGTTPEEVPALTIYKAATPNATRSTVVVMPGGGYMHLAFDYEGTDVAEWLNQRGISAFVLRYRLGPRYQYPVQLWDAQRAIRYVRAHAAEFGVAKDHVGVWGFSAGGHLASTAGTHFDKGDFIRETIKLFRFKIVLRFIQH